MSELVERLRRTAVSVTDSQGRVVPIKEAQEAADALEQAEEKIALLNRTIETLSSELKAKEQELADAWRFTEAAADALGKNAQT